MFPNDHVGHPNSNASSIIAIDQQITKQTMTPYHDTYNSYGEQILKHLFIDLFVCLFICLQVFYGFQ